MPNKPASKPSTPINDGPITVDFLTVIGAREGEDRLEWSRIRASQLHAARRSALFLLAANLAAGAATVVLASAALPRWQLAAWGGLLILIATLFAIRRLASPHRADTYARVEDVRRTAIDGAALAGVWMVVPLAICPHLSVSDAGGVGLVLAILGSTTALTLAPLAFATLIAIGGVGFAVVLHLVLKGDYTASAGVVLFTLLLAVTCLTRARALILLRASDIALGERNETVSLLLREFEDKAADWLWETDAARRVVRASPRFAYALGLDPVSIEGMAFLQVLAGPSWESGDVSDGLRDLAERLMQRESFRDLTLSVTVQGQQRWWQIAASPRHDEDGVFIGFRGVGSDVTEQRESTDKINRMARFDTLTGLPNRLYINEALARAMEDAEAWNSRCAFMMIDLDRFKAVNDTLGHPIGDRLLGRVSERLGQLMTETEIIGRLGGDEFAVVVRDASDAARVEHLARRIIEVLSRPYELDHHTLHIGCSVGIATSPRDGRTAETLVRSADLALYRSKDAGGGVAHAYEPQLHAEAEERRVLEMALRQALSNGEMHLAYQPVVDGDTGRLTGFEALLRWTHPELGPISPVKFVPLAEEARLIDAIGEWVLRTACAEAARWPGHVRIAVNISPEQLHHANFLAIVTSALSQTGLAPGRLELEVTESVFMREGPAATRTLERVLDLGVRLSLDDFGTGYSSLGYLSRTRFSTIKVDRSFVQAASKGVREAVAIIRAVVALAKSLGMKTTAEGVETEAELAMIRDLGCDKVQGYYFGRPLPVEEARAIAVRSAAESVAA